MSTVHKSTVIKDVGDDRTATFIASDESVDRYGDTIDAKGWDVSDFVKNPQFLFGHNSQGLPIGKVLKTWVSGTQFKAKVTFLPKGMDEFADKCFEMLKGGFLSAVSVGFSPIVREPIYDDDGRWIGTHFIKQALLELSLVPIPANSNAVQVARSFDLSTKDFDLLFDRDTAEPSVVNAKAELETLKLRLSS